MAYFQAASSEVGRPKNVTRKMEASVVLSTAIHITPRLLATTTRNMQKTKSGVSV